jgi:hypothetical protein
VILNNVELADLLRAMAISLGAIVLGVLLVGWYKARMARRWSLVFFRMASLLGCSYVIVDIGSRVGTALTWRTPVGICIFVFLITAIRLQSLEEGW